MSVTQIDIDQDALDRVMAVSDAKTKKDAVNLALRFDRLIHHIAAGIGHRVGERNPNVHGRMNLGLSRPYSRSR